MKDVKQISDIDFGSVNMIRFLGTVLSIDSEGDPEKNKPLKATIKFEDSGEIFQVCSWAFEILPALKAEVSNDDVLRFEGHASLYRDTEKQIRIKTVNNIQQKSTKKILKVCDVENIKREMKMLVEKYVSNSENNLKLKKILELLIFSNQKFWDWPAATKIHHAYKHGLATHTLGVMKNAISLWENYQGKSMNIALIVAGAALHDIGKLKEYNEDGSRTVYGNLVPHSVAAYSMIFNTALTLGLDPERDTTLIMLLHIILTHHEKLEFGASTQPNILEALIVARSDMMDANMDASLGSLDLVDVNMNTEKIFSLDGMKFFKWHN